MAPISKLAWFVLYLKIINIFLGKLYISYSKLAKEVKNNIKICKPSGSWVTDPNNILTVLIHNLKSHLAY